MQTFSFMHCVRVYLLYGFPHHILYKIVFVHYIQYLLKHKLMKQKLTNL
jgi:hypothetical protein